jgi:2-polyprenyl-3-methyl-5-hydroxy-6-metoxy-1,4-benzoquinol methylase
VPLVDRNAHHVLKVTGKTGGLIVHVGCGDGKLAAVLHASESYPVHGLDTDADEVNDEDRCWTTP